MKVLGSPFYFLGENKNTHFSFYFLMIFNFFFRKGLIQRARPSIDADQACIALEMIQFVQLRRIFFLSFADHNTKIVQSCKPSHSLSHFWLIKYCCLNIGFPPRWAVWKISILVVIENSSPLPVLNVNQLRSCLECSFETCNQISLVLFHYRVSVDEATYCK